MQTDIAELAGTLRAYFKKCGRAHLPWRGAQSPYEILVSEVMLQQTQASRVMAYYPKFLKAFPDSRALSRAPLSKVLRVWQGLGYNRRGKMLRDAARMIENEFGGAFPHSVEDIERLPGVGPYTARAVAAFAFNQPEVFIETNIRSVFIHHCFPQGSAARSEERRLNLGEKIADAEILPLVGEALKASRMQPRDFYAALMDYGAYLKKTGIRTNARSRQYIKQSKFEGSRRQLRGQILKLLLQKPMTAAQMQRGSGRKLSEVKEESFRLQKEKLIIQKKGRFSIPK